MSGRRSNLGLLSMDLRETCTDFLETALGTAVGAIDLSGDAEGSDNTTLRRSAREAKLGLIHLTKDRTHFIYAESGSRLIA